MNALLKVTQQLCFVGSLRESYRQMSDEHSTAENKVGLYWLIFNFIMSEFDGFQRMVECFFCFIQFLRGQSKLSFSYLG